MCKPVLWLLLSVIAVVDLIAADTTAPKAPSLPRLPFDAEKARTLQQEWARAFGLEVQFTNSVGMKLVLIPGGRYDMGPNGSTRRITLAQPYHLAVTEVSLGQYRRFKAGHKVAGAEEEFNADDRPAAMVSWQDANAFCIWLAEQPEEKAAGRVYALPTEAQWEWAARAGTTTARYFGETDKGQADYSWFNVTYTPNPKNESQGRGRQTVGKLKPNAFGLYDMLGNVWEWLPIGVGTRLRAKAESRSCVVVRGVRARFTAPQSLMTPAMSTSRQTTSVFEWPAGS